MDTKRTLVDDSACLGAAPEIADFRLDRDDWTLFRTIAGLSQKAGVPPELLRRLALKELADNALDEGADVTIDEEGDVYIISDNGRGIPGTAEEIATLFSIRRPLSSSKLWRKPQRGALGNGLRVVAGALLASGGGSLVVTTRGQRLEITPREDGSSSVKATPADDAAGTRVEISFGPDLPEDDYPALWALLAIGMARHGTGYKGLPSAWHQDADSFFELLQAVGDHRVTVRDFVMQFDGCTAAARATKIAGKFMGRVCGSLTRDQANVLLRAIRAAAPNVNFERLGCVGKAYDAHYAFETGKVVIGAREPFAELPFRVEAWSDVSGSQDSSIDVFVNRTPIVSEVRLNRGADKTLAIHGCHTGYQIEGAPKSGGWDVTLNITTPFMPIISDGKMPDLEPFIHEIITAISTSVRKAQRGVLKAAKTSGGLLPASSSWSDLQAFAGKLKAIAETMDFKSSARGWAYILEGHGLSKGEFDACQRVINACRKNGLLPYDFCAEDERRAADGIEAIDCADPAEEADRLLAALKERHESYRPISFWDGVPTYVEVAVEKVDLKSLFAPICAEHHVAITNRAGWSDINSRCAMMLRFKEQEARGKRCVLLYCGDFDPGGLHISETIKKNFRDLSGAIGWSPENLVVKRFGLNRDFIDAQRLTWIDNLDTAGGKLPLNDPEHNDHFKPYVQDYLHAHCSKDAEGNWLGRKVEANALVVRPEAGRQLCRDALARYIDPEALATYERKLRTRRQALRRAIEARLRDGR